MQKFAITLEVFPPERAKFLRMPTWHEDSPCVHAICFSFNRRVTICLPSRTASCSMQANARSHTLSLSKTEQCDGMSRETRAATLIRRLTLTWRINATKAKKKRQSSKQNRAHWELLRWKECRPMKGKRVNKCWLKAAILWVNYSRFLV